MKYPAKAKINISKNDPVKNRASADNIFSGSAWMKFNSLSSGARDPETNTNPKVIPPHNIIAKVKLTNKR